LLEYAQQRLTTLEKEALCRKHAEFFMELVVDGESKLMSADQRTWLELLNAEYDNIRAALAWTSRNNREQAMRFAGALGRFWLVRGYWDEGSRWLAQLLEDDQVSQDSAARVRAMNAAANLAFNRGEYASSDEWAGRALTLP
jgi:predicted ATPase